MRRIFFSLAILLTAVSLTASGQRRGQRRHLPMPQKEMALQLYSLRDMIGDADKYAKNHEQVFKDLKSFGYTSVEAANYNDGKFYGVSAQQFKKDVSAAGLTALSSHATYGLNEEELANHDFTKAMKWWDKAIKAHKDAGMKYIVTPYGPVPKTLKEAQTLCDYHNAVGKKCREAGISYGYHSHSHEYQKVEGQVWIDYMMRHVAPENMFWQMDVYWCVMAQQSPVEWFKKFPGRFKMLHIKDKYEVGESGMVNFEAIFRKARLIGLQDYVVELEDTDGSITPLEGVKRSARYLRAARYVRPAYPVR
ncbi:MAG: sugar phosphate isomerase/epimerase family protein [Prevotella sp.]|jgi:sugar phosphate isomerase/epimerase